MHAVRRILVSGAAAVLVVAPAMSCARGSAPPTDAAAAPSSPAAAVPGPAPASDEDLIRQRLTVFQDAYNTQDWDAYLDSMCTTARDLFTDAAMARLKQTRADQGLTNTTVTAVDVHGDEATATLDARNELLGRRTIELDLVREDGWKVCQTTPVR